MKLYKKGSLIIMILFALGTLGYCIEHMELRNVINETEKSKSIPPEIRNIMSEFQDKSLKTEADGTKFFIENIQPYLSKVKITISGIVLDKSQKPIKNARIVLRQIRDNNSEALSDYDKHLKKEMKANDDGKFVCHIPPFNCYKLSGYMANGIFPNSNYELIISASGYKPETYNFVNINKEILYISIRMMSIYQSIYNKENRKFPEMIESILIPKINTDFNLTFKCILKE